MDETASTVTFTVDADGLITSVSSGCHALLGWTAESLVGTPLTRVIPERFHEPHREGFRRFLETGAMPLENRVTPLPALHANGAEVDIALELQRVPPGDRSVASGTIRLAGESADKSLSRVVEGALRADLSQPELIRACVGAAAREHGWSVGAVWWVDPWMDRLSTIAVWEEESGTHPHYVEATTAAVFARGEGLIGGAWQSEMPHFCPDLWDDPHWSRRDSVIADGLHGALIFPLAWEGELVGVVEMIDHAPRTFGVNDREVVWTMADELARVVAERLRREQEQVRRQRIDMALTAGRMGVWSYHHGTGIVTVDAQMEALVGVAPGSFDGSLDAFVAHIHADDRDPVVAELVAAIEQGERFDRRFRAVSPDGKIVWLQTSAATVEDTDGRYQGLTGLSFDVSAHILSEKRAALAADVGRALVSREPHRARLQRTVEAVVEHIGAAFARIWTLPLGSEILTLEASAGMYVHLDGDHSSIRVGEFKIGMIAETRRPHLTNDVRNDSMVSDPAWAAREGMSAFAGYPLIVGDQLVGVLGLFAKHALPQATLSALAAIADTVAISILQHWSLSEMQSLMDRAREHASEMEAAMRERAEVAEVLQASLLPPSLPEVPGLTLGAAYLPGLEAVGGDFYDVWPLHESWGFMIGDVCGRGPEAARFTALARHSLRTTLQLGYGPSDALAALNEALLAADNDARFCTVVCGTIRRDPATASAASSVTARLSVGGHPLPLVLRVDGRVEPVGSHDSLLGVGRVAPHQETDVQLSPGDVLVLYTDGVIEARNSVELFGEERLASLLESLQGQSAPEVVDAIVREVTTFASTTSDDTAMLAIGVDT